MMWCQLWVLLHLKCYVWSRYPWHLRTYRILTGLAHNPSEWQLSHADSFRLCNFFNTLDDFLVRSLGIIPLHRKVSSCTFRNLSQRPAKESTSNGGPGDRANFEPLWDDDKGWRERGTCGNIHRGLGTSRVLLHGRWGCSDFALIWKVWVCCWWRSLRSWEMRFRCNRLPVRTLHCRNCNITLSTININNFSRNAYIARHSMKTCQCIEPTQLAQHRGGHASDNIWVNTRDVMYVSTYCLFNRSVGIESMTYIHACESGTNTTVSNLHWKTSM